MGIADVIWRDCWIEVTADTELGVTTEGMKDLEVRVETRITTDFAEKTDLSSERHRAFVVRRRRTRENPSKVGNLVYFFRWSFLRCRTFVRLFL